MEVQTKTITIREVRDAIKADGLRKLRQEWANFNKDGELVGGCALTQAASLGILPSADVIQYLPDAAGYYYRVPTLYTELQKFQNQSEKYKASREGPLDSPFYNGLSETIIRLYDETLPDFVYRNGDVTGRKNKTYKLRTWKQVCAMIDDVLDPYLDEKITVATLGQFLKPKKVGN